MPGAIAAIIGAQATLMNQQRNQQEERRNKMVHFIEQEVELGHSEEVKPIKILRWILETRIYPSGKVVSKVFPTRGATEAYKRKEEVGEAEQFKKTKETEDL